MVFLMSQVPARFKDGTEQLELFVLTEWMLRDLRVSLVDANTIKCNVYVLNRDVDCLIKFDVMLFGITLSTASDREIKFDFVQFGSREVQRLVLFLKLYRHNLLLSGGTFADSGWFGFKCALVGKDYRVDETGSNFDSGQQRIQYDATIRNRFDLTIRIQVICENKKYVFSVDGICCTSTFRSHADVSVELIAEVDRVFSTKTVGDVDENDVQLFENGSHGADWSRNSKESGGAGDDGSRISLNGDTDEASRWLLSLKASVNEHFKNEVRDFNEVGSVVPGFSVNFTLHNLKIYLVLQFDGVWVLNSTCGVGHVCFKTSTLDGNLVESVISLLNLYLAASLNSVSSFDSVVIRLLGIIVEHSETLDPRVRELIKDISEFLKSKNR